MKTTRPILFSTAAMVAGTFFFLASNATAADDKIKLPSGDAEFLQEEAAAGSALVRIAGLGERMAKRKDIKAFAAVIVADHTEAHAELAALAKGKDVDLNSEPDAKLNDSIEKLGDAKGSDFDKEFLAMVVTTHKKCVKNFENASEDSEDSEVKAWATVMLPKAQAHLEKAEALESDPTAKADADANGVEKGEADNTARNMRDRDQNTLTPLDQGNSKADIDMTAGIRRAIVEMEDLSVNAQNVKIITNAGRITLRGPVESADEKRILGEIATGLATAESVDNQLEVSNAASEN